MHVHDPFMMACKCDIREVVTFEKVSIEEWKRRREDLDVVIPKDFKEMIEDHFGTEYERIYLPEKTSLNNSAKDLLGAFASVFGVDEPVSKDDYIKDALCKYIDALNKKLQLCGWITDHGNDDHCYLNEEDYMKAYDNVVIPSRSTPESAAYDLTCPFDVVIPPRMTVMIPTGLKFTSARKDIFMLIVPRSSFPLFDASGLATSASIIETDYYNNPKNEGHMMLPIYNNNDVFPRKIKAGERICQCVFTTYFLKVGDVPVHERREGGFGHSGKF